MTLLAAKILLAPLCVVAVSLAGRRWGVAVAGLLGGLPGVAKHEWSGPPLRGSSRGIDPTSDQPIAHFVIRRRRRQVPT